MRRGYLIILIVLLSGSGCVKKNLSDEKSSGTSLGSTSGNITSAENKDIIKGNSVKESGIDDTENHIGLFSVTMSGYQGEIFIGVSDGMFYGTIKFSNWGNGTPQPLKELKVNEDRVYFVRSITSREEIEKYGGTAMFTQEFYGIYSKDRKIIRGYYRYAGTQDSWEAVKK